MSTQVSRFFVLLALFGSACGAKKDDGLQCDCPKTLEEYCNLHDCPASPSEALDRHMVSLMMTRGDITIVGVASLTASGFVYFEDDQLVGVTSGGDIASDCDSQCPYALGQIPVATNFAAGCYVYGACEDFEVCTISSLYDLIGRIDPNEYEPNREPDAGLPPTPACPGHPFSDAGF